MKIIKNGCVLTMDGDEIENGFVAFENGKIVAVGPMDGCPEGESYDANGGYIVPGLVDAHSHIGMWEDSLGSEGADGNEDTDPITPQLRAIDAINPMDRAFSEALAAGVTTVVTGPGSANPIGGTFAALKTYGRRVDDMLIKAEAAMKFAFGENPKGTYGEKKQFPSTRMGTAAIIREALIKAEMYKDREDHDFDFKSESLAHCIGEEPMLVKAHAHRADDIFTALRIAREFGLNMTIEHCTEGHLIADILKDENVGVCVGPSLGDRGKPELSNLTYETAAVLSKQGLPVAIITDHPEIPEKHLPLCAALAARAGMDRMEALRAITVNAAKLCGIADRVGSLTVGKDADIVVFDHFPLDFEAKAIAVFVNGEQKI
ncbi:MAG: amidohydrolase [Oscillospiraceae bacterium]|nr:amidohydrolase [Oscillospiraceae bacterium]